MKADEVFRPASIDFEAEFLWDSSTICWIHLVPFEFGYDYAALL